jgi:hypothetical protein
MIPKSGYRFSDKIMLKQEVGLLMRVSRFVLGLVITVASPLCALAQQPAPAQQPQAQPAQQSQPQSTWDTLPRMQLERQFAGPLRDTIVQRWRDPTDGTICYIYLPISAQHSPPTPSGFVNYGSNSIGSLSCLHGAPARGSTPSAAKAAPK